MQPLQDNLQSQTYETFERDPVKYAKYEEAITCALVHLQKLRAKKMTSSSSQDGGDSSAAAAPLQLLVVGAGRGPLIAAALRSSAAAQVCKHFGVILYDKTYIVVVVSEPLKYATMTPTLVSYIVLPLLALNVIYTSSLYLPLVRTSLVP